MKIPSKVLLKPLSTLERLAALVSTHMPGFETVGKALAENVIRIKQLRLAGNSHGELGYRTLANKLEGCSVGAACGSMACKLCQRTRRLELIKQYLPRIKTTGQYVAVTLVFYQEMFPSEGIIDWQLEPLKERLRKQLTRIGFSGLIVGGFEMDHHVCCHEPGCSHWMPHFHLLVPNEPEKLEQLARYMGRDKNQRVRKGKKNRPMRTDKFQHPIKQLSYCVGGIWAEYVWFLNGKGEVEKMRRARRIRNRSLYAKSLLKLDQMSDALLTFRVNVQKL